jgi:hypothetical protein
MTPHIFRYVRPFIAIILVLACCCFVFALLWHAMPEANREVMLLVAGYLLSKLGDVTAYYFGNSKDKSDAEQAARADMTTTTTTTSSQPAAIKGKTRLSELLITARDESLPMAQREEAIKLINEIYPELGKTTFETLPNIPS